MMGRKIALVGTCPSNVLALQLPADWELWVCSPGNDRFPRVDLWFELHGDLDMPGEMLQPYIDWLNRQSFPQMVHRVDLFPRGQRFPIEEMVKLYGDYFFTSQPALMLAYALSLKPEEVALFGLDMQATSEYSAQKPAMLHFVWLAMQQGVRVMCPGRERGARPAARSTATTSTARSAASSASKVGSSGLRSPGSTRSSQTLPRAGPTWPERWTRTIGPCRLGPAGFIERTERSSKWRRTGPTS
jgi:hypothetical protein